MAIIIRTFDIFQISFTFVEFSLKINILLSVAGNSCVRGNLLGYKMDRPDQNRPQLHPANVSLKGAEALGETSCCTTWTIQTCLVLLCG